MNRNNAETSQICSACGTESPSHAAQCWMCLKPLSKAATSATVKQSELSKAYIADRRVTYGIAFGSVIVLGVGITLIHWALAFIYVPLALVILAVLTGRSWRYLTPLVAVAIFVCFLISVAVAFGISCGIHPLQIHLAP